MTNPTAWKGMNPETVKYLTPKELDAFFAEIEAEPKERRRKRDLALFQLMLRYGLRLSEARQLKVENVDWRLSPPQVFVKRLKRRGAYGSWRNLTPEDQKALKSWLAVREKFKYAKLNPYLFITPNCGREEMLSESAIYVLARQYGEKAGIPYVVHPHMFRHTCGVLLAKQGYSAFAIRDYLGHASVVSTQVYVELAHPDAVEQDAKMVEAMKVW